MTMACITTGSYGSVESRTTRTICEYAALTMSRWTFTHDGRKHSLSFAFRIGKLILTWTWGGYPGEEANTLKKKVVSLAIVICHLNFNNKLQSLWIPRTSGVWFPFFVRQMDMAYICVLHQVLGLFLNDDDGETCRIWEPDQSQILTRVLTAATIHT